MALTSAQLTTLKADILSKSGVGGPLQTLVANNDYAGIAAYYNVEESPAWVVWRKSVSTAEVGKVVSYVAIAAMTTANLDRLNNFYTLNPSEFDPSRSDIRTFFSDTFSGALGGAGQATRDAMEANYRRNALRGEKLYSTGTGTTATPAVLVYEGTISANNVNDAVRL